MEARVRLRACDAGGAKGFLQVPERASVERLPGADGFARLRLSCRQTHQGACDAT